jgi:DNA-binding winged helix-turn-helix (wHTH) protein/tetratricopeptide (TPR) repeat protein
VSAQVVEFGAFRLDVGKAVLWRGGRVVPLTPKALAVLGVLLDGGGDVVTKADLMARVWPETAVHEANLSVTVAALRRAVDPQPGGRSWVETVPRRGYRFAGSFRRTGAPEHTSLAVLPMRGLGPDTETHLGLGLADALISRLTNVGGLRVRPTGAVAHMDTTSLDPQAAAVELDVDAVVTGTVQREGDSLRLSLQLVPRRPGLRPWATRLDTPSTSLFDAQERLAEEIARALRARLAPGGGGTSPRHVPPPRASEAYMRGRYFWARLDPAGVAKAIGCFGEAALVDPGWAAPHAGLADAYILMGLGGVLSPDETWRLAAECAARALDRDEGFAEAHVSAAWIALGRDWNWDSAWRSIRRAIALQPFSHSARLWHGLFLGLAGDVPAALRELARVREIDPLSGFAGAIQALLHSLSGDPDEGLELARRTLELRPDRAFGYWSVGVASLAAGRADKAVAALRRAVELSEGGLVMRAQLARVLARTGDAAASRSVLAELDRLTSPAYVSPYQRATVLLDLGEREASLDALELAARVKDPWVVFLGVDEALLELREDPRFASLVLRIHGAAAPEDPSV